MIFSTITQSDLDLTCDLENIPPQHSGDIEIKLIRDAKYNDYVCTPYFKCIKNRFLECESNTKSKAVAINSTSGIFKLPKDAFKLDGYIAIAFSFAKNNEVIQTNPIVYKITASVGDGEFLDNKPSWQQVVIQLCEDWVNENIKTDLDKMESDRQASIDEAIKQQTKSNEQQIAIDNKLRELRTLETTVNTNESNRQTAEVKRQSDTTKVINNCNDKITEINTKLENGDFVGPTGITPDIEIGNVSVGTASVIRRGTNEKPIFDFKLPAGDMSGYYDKTESDNRYLKITGGNLRGGLNIDPSNLRFYNNDSYKDVFSILNGMLVFGTSEYSARLRTTNKNTRPQWVYSDTSGYQTFDLAIKNDIKTIEEITGSYTPNDPSNINTIKISFGTKVSDWRKLRIVYVCVSIHTSDGTNATNNGYKSAESWMTTTDGAIEVNFKALAPRTEHTVIVGYTR